MGHFGMGAGGTWELGRLLGRSSGRARSGLQVPVFWNISWARCVTQDWLSFMPPSCPLQQAPINPSPPRPTHGHQQGALWGGRAGLRPLSPSLALQGVLWGEGHDPWLGRRGGQDQAHQNLQASSLVEGRGW